MKKKYNIPVMRVTSVRLRCSILVGSTVGLSLSDSYAVGSEEVLSRGNTGFWGDEE